MAHPSAGKASLTEVGIMVNRVLTSEEFADLATDLLQQGLTVTFRARGKSMKPFIRDGDVVAVEPVAPEQLRVMDIVFGRSSNGKNLLHRLVLRRSGTEIVLLTQGDASLNYREELEAGQLVGRVCWIERDGRRRKTTAGRQRLIARLWNWSRPFRYLLAGSRRHVQRVAVKSAR